MERIIRFLTTMLVVMLLLWGILAVADQVAALLP